MEHSREEIEVELKKWREKLKREEKAWIPTSSIPWYTPEAEGGLNEALVNVRRLENLLKELGV